MEDDVIINKEKREGYFPMPGDGFGDKLRENEWNGNLYLYIYIYCYAYWKERRQREYWEIC